MNPIYGKNMMLFTSYHKDGQGNSIPTFKMMPVTDSCPYMEVIYDPTTTLLVVLSKDKKESFQFIPKLNDNGDVLEVKGTPRKSGHPYREQRVMLNLQQEYFIMEKDEQENFVKRFAVNAEEFDYNKYLRDLEAERTNPVQPVEQKPITDKHGAPMSIAKK